MNQRCLIVDDEEDFADFIADALDILGHTVDICTDPTDIGKHFSRSHSVVILDLFMPGMDGIEVLRFLHDNRAEASLIFVSGKDKFVLNAASELAQEWGIPVLGALQKPFTVDQLETVMSSVKPNGTGRGIVNPAAVTVEDIRDAIDQDSFTLAYQPQFALSTDSVCGVEALIRWRHPDKGSISPSIFIPMAEQAGLIDRINLYVAQEAIDQLGRWKASGLPVSVSINVSPASIADLDFPEYLTELTARHRVAPKDVTVEVTETAVMADVGRYMDILTRLRMKGFGLAIDDFGTGYSSLQQLIRLPFSELKIDRAFVGRSYDDGECLAVTRMAIMLAHEFGMHVVAEGVEDEATLQLLRMIGCDKVQGFHCARPMEPVVFEQWMRNGNQASAEISLPTRRLAGAQGG